MLKQVFQPMAAQLSMKAVLLLAERLAFGLHHISKTDPSSLFPNLQDSRHDGTTRLPGFYDPPPVLLATQTILLDI